MNKDRHLVSLTFDGSVQTPAKHNGIGNGRRYGVGSNPVLATCETNQVLLAGVPGGFSRGSPVFAQPTDWHVSYELK